jgi:hypothetical protein
MRAARHVVDALPAATQQGARHEKGAQTLFPRGTGGIVNSGAPFFLKHNFKSILVFGYFEPGMSL